MNQEQFEAACAAAIEGIHDLKLDGPLLIATRMNGDYLLADALAEEGWQVWPEYACAVGRWPGQSSSNYGEFLLEPKDAISALVCHLQERWQARQPEDEAPAPEAVEVVFTARQMGKTAAMRKALAATGGTLYTGPQHTTSRGHMDITGPLNGYIE